MRIGTSSNLSEEVIRIFHHDFVIISSPDCLHKIADAAVNMLSRIIKKNKPSFHKKFIHIFEVTFYKIILMIAVNVLKGEILASEKNYDSSIATLSKAVAFEDHLNYDEPPDWFFSVRHHLGAVQIEAGKYKDAIITYQEDLKHFKNNGWAQHGLKLAYQKLSEPNKVKEVERLLAKSWATADTKIETSRIK